MTHNSSSRHVLVTRPRATALCIVAACLLLAATPAFARQRTRSAGKRPGATQAEATQTGAARAGVVVRWAGRSGIRRYRLQLATDEKFSDIVFDRAVEGQQYTVTELAPGDYYWRVAPAAAETSSFSQPQRVTVTAAPGAVPSSNAQPTAGKVAPAPVITLDESAGWRTAVGEVSRVAAARLRPGAVTDFVGVTVNGRVFAVDGVNGVSLWNARVEANAPAGFAPVVISAGETANILASADGGVRLLRGDTGREMWRARLEGAAASGTVADLDGNGTGELIVVTSGTPMLYVLAADTGRIVSSAKLEAEVIGSPVSYAAGSTRGVLLTLRDGTVRARGHDLAPTGSLKLDTNPTTAPIMISRGEARVVVLGSELGLVALGFPEMRMLGQIVSENDPVRGTLATADVDGDGTAEIAMVTRSGRVALVGTNDGTVRWFAEGAGGAENATFADLNGDRVLDVIVAGGGTFILGFSGRDGTLLMRADEPDAPGRAASPRGRTVAVAPAPGGGLMLVGADAAGTGLRAIELKADAARARRP
jgi:outer membrane protein assembly factor BamB